MAYSILCSLENTINQILDQFSISPHEKEQILSLNKCVISFQAFLEDFPEQAKKLEARIRDVAAEVEDTIEWSLWKQTWSKTRNIKRISVLRGIKFKYQLHRVRDAMDSIAAEVVEIKNSIITEGKQPGDSVGASSTSQVADTGEVNMVGFNEDLIEMKAGLCGRPPQLQVLPIFGMGGIGKTTFARNVYSDQLIVEHFQIRVWVTVSQDFSERRILLDLLDSMKEFDSKSMEVNSETQERHDNESPKRIPELSNSEMALKVHKILIGRRFLIVMDDIWSTKVLDDIRHLFPDNNNGSRIMLTTRLTEIATYASSTTISHEMRLMDEDQSWDLLCQKVFVHQDRVPRELESIGREIARSCGGLPLAIVVIEGILSAASKTLTSWEEVARNIRSSLAKTNGLIEEILSLSYNHLPHHLKACFLYMGGFPEDHQIKVKYLIRLWIVEYFVKPGVSKRFEETAEEYLEDLVDRNLIMITKRKSDGKIKYCGLHDTVREMCIKISQVEKFLVHVKDRRELKLLKRMRRISICDSNEDHFSNIYSSTIRTIMYFKYELGSFGCFRLLRVLNLPRVRFDSHLVPDQFFELFHLRYLSFYYHCQSIPRAISNLQNLQTLIIEGFISLSLPCEIWNMLQLRHLILPSCPLPDIIPTTSALQNLQTLGKVKNLKCSISTLNLIPNLKELRLTYFYGSGELLLQNLVHLSRLEKLHLELQDGQDSAGKPNLVVLSSLKKLTLIGWGKKRPYLNLVGPFPNVEVLKLKSYNFERQVWTTKEEDFPQLKFLLIEKSNISQWETESSHFPRLKTLHIRTCLGLSKIPECIGEIPMLELIELKLCMESLAESAKEIQEEVQSNGNDDFQVRCIDCTETVSSLARKQAQLRRKPKVWSEEEILYYKLRYGVRPHEFHSM